MRWLRGATPLLLLLLGAALGQSTQLLGEEVPAQDAVSALHREYDSNWRGVRVGSAAADPAADEEEVAAETAAVAAQVPPEDSAFEDAVPKRRRYSRKRPRPSGDGEPGEDDAQAPRRRKIQRPAEEDASTDGEEYRRRRPIQRRRRPTKTDAEVEPAADAELENEKRRFGNPYEQPATTTEKLATPGDLKALLKQTAGQLSLSELLQNRNLSLADLLKGNRGALSALTASPATERGPDQEEVATDRAFIPSHRPSPALLRATSRAYDDVPEPTTERHNSFVPSKPRRLPPVNVRPHTTPFAPSSTEEPEITTSRPRRLPGIVTRVKAEQEEAQPTHRPEIPTTTERKEAKEPSRHVLPGREPSRDVLDPMSPEMMAMITLEAADPHTSKPRRIPAQGFLPTPNPKEATTGGQQGEAQEDEEEDSQPKPEREFYPLNVDSLEITTPRLMGVSKARPWQPPADRMIDAQVFSPGSLPKYRPHGFTLSTLAEAKTSTSTATSPTSEEPATTPADSKEDTPTVRAPAEGAGASPAATLQNTGDHFKLENETLDLKEENAVDKRKIPSVPARPFLGTTVKPENGNELGKQDDRVDKKKTLTGPRRLPPTLAGSRRLPSLNRQKNTTDAVKEPTERPKFPGLARPKPKDTLLPPTRFALPLPEVIPIEKMIEDAKNRGALKTEPTGASTTTTEAAMAVFSTRDEILDLLKSEQSSARLARILAARNMTLEDLIQQRERGSSQLHFADFFRNATKKEDQPVNLVPKEIAPAEKKESVNILRSFHEVPKYPFAYASTDDSEEAASSLSLVNVKPAGIVLPAEPGERYRGFQDSAHRTPRIFDSMPSFTSSPPKPKADPSGTYTPPKPAVAQPYPIPTFKLPEPPAPASNPYLVIKHVTSTPKPARAAPDNAILEHVGEIRQISNSVEGAIVVDSDPYAKVKDDSVRLLPSGVKSAIIASTVICGLAIVGFLTIFIVFRWRQKRALIRARGAILCEQLQRGSFRGRSLSPVLVNVSKSQAPYYSKKDLNSRATSNTASNRHYYLWRSLRKTFQEDDME